MPKIDVSRYIEASGVRKARFGGYEPEDVRAAIQALCVEYEQRLGKAEAAARKAAQENAALQQHCQSLTAQNQRLSGQNAALAGSSETYSRQKQDLDSRVSSLTERNHSLSDQIAVLRLKNSDLQKETDKYKERAEQAEAELRIKGRALEDAKNALEESRRKVMEEAEQKAGQTVTAAQERAAQIEENARAEARAVDAAAREQAKAQAQKLVDAAAAEANEIQNAHQLRLNNLRAEVREMEAQRAALIEYLGLMSNKLEELHNQAVAHDPVAEAEAADNSSRALESELPELHTVPTPDAKLDLSPEVVARAVDELRAQAAADPDEEETPAEETPAASPAEPEPEKPAEPPTPDEQRPTGDPNHQTGPALTEVPGAIFSSPIVRQADVQKDETPPAAQPRVPVMPNFEDDEEDPEPAVEAPSAAEKRQDEARRKALRALRALQQMQQRLEK